MYGDTMQGQVRNNVCVARMKAGMTQQELADRVRVTRQTIIAIEKGNYTPSVSLALKIAKIFKGSVEDIFYF